MFKRHSSKKSKSTTEDTSWIVEGIVAYLRSPTWTSPILNFIEDRCESFTNSEESSFEHTEIHKSYKKLVERLLGEYMKELGITEAQFSEACSIHNQDIARLDGNFENIWAADDFILFKRLMIKYNAEIQREAMRMFERENGKGRGSEESNDLAQKGVDVEHMNKMLKPSKSGHLEQQKKLKKQEQDDMMLAIQFSKMEMERLNAIVDEEKRLIEQAIKLSLASSATENNSSSSAVTSPPSKSSTLTKPVSISSPVPEGFSASSLEKPASYEAPEIGKDTSSDKPAKNPESPLKSVEKKQKIDESLPPLKTKKDISSSEAASAWLDRAMREITEAPKNAASTAGASQKMGGISPEEIEKRKAYLQQQRDKLLALKRKERDKELKEYMDNKEAGSGSSEPKTVDPEEEKRLASRRAVAERLKREVINKK